MIGSNAIRKPRKVNKMRRKYLDESQCKNKATHLYGSGKIGVCGRHKALLEKLIESKGGLTGDEFVEIAASQPAGDEASRSAPAREAGIPEFIFCGNCLEARDLYKNVDDIWVVEECEACGDEHYAYAG